MIKLNKISFRFAEVSKNISNTQSEQEQNSGCWGWGWGLGLTSQLGCFPS